MFQLAESGKNIKLKSFNEPVRGIDIWLYYDMGQSVIDI